MGVKDLSKDLSAAIKIRALCCFILICDFDVFRVFCTPLMRFFANFEVSAGIDTSMRAEI
jgi:hypothetical protein